MSINLSAKHAAPEDLLILSDAMQISGSSGVGTLIIDKEKLCATTEGNFYD